MGCMIVRAVLSAIGMRQASDIGCGCTAIYDKRIELSLCCRRVIDNARLPEIMYDTADDQACFRIIVVYRRELIADAPGIRPMSFHHPYPIVIIKWLIED